MQPATEQTAPISGAAPRFHQYLTLTTMRRNGNRVATVVWFAAANGKLYVRTALDSGKVRRIQHDGRVLVAPASATGQPRGVTVAGRARLLPQLEARHAERALEAKYGLLAGAFRLMERRYDTTLVVIEITPDPGPGTAELLLEHMPDAQRIAAIARGAAIAIGVGVGIAGLLTWVRRMRRS